MFEAGPSTSSPPRQLRAPPSEYEERRGKHVGQVLFSCPIAALCPWLLNPGHTALCYITRKVMASCMIEWPCCATMHCISCLRAVTGLGTCTQTKSRSQIREQQQAFTQLGGFLAIPSASYASPAAFQSEQQEYQKNQRTRVTPRLYRHRLTA